MDPRVRETTRLLSKNIKRGFKIEEAARAVNLSPSRLRHLFKRETGLSPGQYLKRLKMEQARKLLEETFLTVKEVMRRVGVSDESHFVRDFKKHCGLPPVRYRNLHGGRSASGQQERPMNSK